MRFSTLSLLLLIGGFIPTQGQQEGSVRGSHEGRQLNDCQLFDLNFDELSRGEQVGDQYSQYELKLSATGGYGDMPHVFDTSKVGNSDYGDPDLGSPNERCGGPGVGEGGEPDSPGANCDFLGNVLIVQEDNGCPDIPDDNADGGSIIFDFTTPALYVYQMHLLDADYGGVIFVDYETDTGIKTRYISLTNLGDNAVTTETINVENVVKITLRVNRAGAVSSLTFCPGMPTVPTLAPPRPTDPAPTDPSPTPPPPSGTPPPPSGMPPPPSGMPPTLAPTPPPMLSVTGIPTVYETTHLFSIADIMGGFDGSTFGSAGAKQDTTILCGAPGSTASGVCPPPLTDKDGTVLYPIDSEFRFDVLDFVSGKRLTRDDNWLEGFAGNVAGGGLKISNVGTSTYKVKPPLGTWCQGLSSTSVKCSTEHYSVMEHVLSCHEVCPYMLADPITGKQAVLSFDDGSVSFDCADAELDNNVKTVVNGQVGGSYVPPPEIPPNDNTDVLNGIATSRDYSITYKDDGKVLYRWGSLVKLPTDVRLYAKLELPDEWKVPGADYVVKSAKLIIKHQITNNPNDQVRPEDLENEAATGRKPSYAQNIVDGVETWTSRVPCFEGDGDFIDGDDGTVDPNFLPVGTVFKGQFKGDNLAAENPPQLFSADLREGFTNGFYTTLNRDPFEWSYRDTTKPDNIFDFVGFNEPLTEADEANMNLELVSGPRWRLND